MDLLLAFVTGLTTGGLSCLAVQGGLLAGSIAHEVEQTVRDQPVKRRGKATPRATPRVARPIVLFLSAKLVAYTILGFLLGLLGSVLQLSLMTQAILQITVGIFMLGTALRMFNVHPIFRYFVLEPPSAVSRYIRRKAKGQASAVTPLFLGALTVLIPCGVTQAMMAVAMATGDPLAGAATMFAFILGTSPVFFAIAYLATRLGSKLEAGFIRVVAITMLVLGLISINAGLTLTGSPYSVTNLRIALASAGAEEVATAQTQVPSATPPRAPRATPTLPAEPKVPGQGNVAGPASPNGARSNGPTKSAAAAGSAGSQAAGGTTNSQAASSTGGAADSTTSPADGKVTINVTSGGYSPRTSHAKAGQPLKLELVTKGTGGCARAFVIPSLGVQKILQATGSAVIDVPAQKAGSKLYFSCSMGMYSGMIVFDG